MRSSECPSGWKCRLWAPRQRWERPSMEGVEQPHISACWALTLAGFEGWVDGVGESLDNWSILARQLAIDWQPLIAGGYSECGIEQTRRARSRYWFVCEGSSSRDIVYRPGQPSCLPRWMALQAGDNVPALPDRRERLRCPGRRPLRTWLSQRRLCSTITCALASFLSGPGSSLRIG